MVQWFRLGLKDTGFQEFTGTDSFGSPVFLIIYRLTGNTTSCAYILFIEIPVIVKAELPLICT